MKVSKTELEGIYKQLKPSRDKWHKDIDDQNKFIDSWFDKNRKRYLKNLKKEQENFIFPKNYRKLSEPLSLPTSGYPHLTK